MAVATPIIAAVVGAAGTVYAASQQKTPNLPKAPVVPKLPDTKAVAASTEQADIQAKTAGGSILSNPKTNALQVNDGANAVRKTLLGT